MERSLEADDWNVGRDQGVSVMPSATKRCVVQRHLLIEHKTEVGLQKLV